MDLTPEEFDEIKGKQVTVRFYENGEVKRMVQGKVVLIHRTAPISQNLETSLLSALEFEDGSKVCVEEVLAFMDNTAAKKVYVEFE